jgi:transglutaminase-like putative cysteine protease
MRRSIVLSFLIAATAVLLNPSPARADGAKKEFAGYTNVWYHAHYDINPDGTHVETQAWALKVLTEQGVSEANSSSVSFSDRLETATILAAYTLKKDGRKINVPPSNFQDETNTGKGATAPMFSDIRTKTVAFPDVAVGDTVVFSYKLTQKEATFPGNFSLLKSFSEFQVYDEVKISVSAPTSLELRVYSRGVEGGEAPSSDGRRNWAWSYRNEQVATPESGAVSSRDYGPLIVATTFKDYGALAAAYNARAKAKSEPTNRIRKLANDLTLNAHTPREQARVLYNWVSHNIKFAGNCVGVGAVVPHDVDVVLANRMGDCKDHTALLQALLAAKGIASTPALINSGSSYTLPEAPCIEAFNHVISYIPSLDLYADSTSEYTPFGSLPLSDAGKPVIPDVLEAQFTTPEAANSPLPAKGEATPQQMAGYWDEANKLPKKEFLRDLADPDQMPTSVGLDIVNGEYVWVVTIDSGPIRPAFEARVRAEFAKFTDKKVVFGVQKRADIHGGNSSGAWLPPPGTN